MDPQLQEMLSQLRDLHSPEAISWWPVAPGWWLLLVLVLAGIFGLVIWQRQQKLLLGYKKESLTLLDQAYRQLDSDQNRMKFLSECSQLLRRVLLYRQGRHQVAHLSGNHWRKLLESSEPRLSESSMEALVVQQYRPAPEFDTELLYQDMRSYLSNLEPARRV